MYLDIIGNMKVNDTMKTLLEDSKKDIYFPSLECIEQIVTDCDYVEIFLNKDGEKEMPIFAKTFAKVGLVRQCEKQGIKVNSDKIYYSAVFYLDMNKGIFHEEQICAYYETVDGIMMEEIDLGEWVDRDNVVTEYLVNAIKTLRDKDEEETEEKQERNADAEEEKPCAVALENTLLRFVLERYCEILRQYPQLVSIDDMAILEDIHALYYGGE